MWVFVRLCGEYLEIGGEETGGYLVVGDVVSSHIIRHLARVLDRACCRVVGNNMDEQKRAGIDLLRSEQSWIRNDRSIGQWRGNGEVRMVRDIAVGTN